MRVAAVIAEYNPFHLGHSYQLEQIRQQAQADAVVVLMSGNVVQRGEFAILDKWTRAKIALDHGADLVLELPLTASLQSADYFARGSVAILAKLSIDVLAFGTESLQTEELITYVDWLEAHQDQVDEYVKQYLKLGLAYPAAYGKAIAKAGEPFDSMSQPNHLLGVQYIKQLRQYAPDTPLIAIPRLYKDSHGNQLLSGSAIRTLARNRRPVGDVVPSQTAQALTHSELVDWTDYYPYLRYQIESLGREGLDRVVGLEEGVGKYIYEGNLTAHSWSQLRTNLTSKRFTQAAIQRKLMAILLNISQAQWQDSLEANLTKPMVRVLAYSECGRKLLRQYQALQTIDVFSNLTQERAVSYALNLKADQIMALNMTVPVAEQNRARYPISDREE